MAILNQARSRASFVSFILKNNERKNALIIEVEDGSTGVAFVADLDEPCRSSEIAATNTNVAAPFSPVSGGAIRSGSRTNLRRRAAARQHQGSSRKLAR
jgi:hypothetical protein